MDDNDKKTFIYKEEGLPSQFFASPSGHHPTLSSTSIEREDIQRAVHDPNHVADSRSVFGGSQSASASMSANMHRIVEDVEKLVESDTYDNMASVANEPPSFPSSGQLPTPSAFKDEHMVPRNTPIAPPGLGPPMAANSAPGLARTPSSHAYTPLIPNLSSIWNTSLPSGRGAAAGGGGGGQGGGGGSNDLSGLGAPRAPPGLEQTPSSSSNPIYQGSITSSNLRPSQDHQSSSISSSIAHDILRQQQQQLMMTRNQYATMNPLNASPPPMPTPSSPWTSSPHRAPSASLGWESLNVNSPSAPQLPPSSFGMSMPPVSSHQQAVSSNLPYASWANDAFLGSSHAQIPPSSALSGYQGFSSPPPGLSGRNRSSGQLGAIGETPPCGQGG